MKRFWMSWYVKDEDYRPLTFPPNGAILGWWCTGYDDQNCAVLCGLVQAKTESQARKAILQDWPGISWRFVEKRDPDYVVTSDRFPLSDWMRPRMESANA